MKKVLVLLVLVFAVWLYLNRERVYLHDFFAHIDAPADTTRSVYINASNDLLLISSANPPTLELVRPSGAAPVLADSLNCLHFIACLTRKEDSAALANAAVTADAQVVKSSRIVTFKDTDGRVTTVHLW